MITTLSLLGVLCVPAVMAQQREPTSVPRPEVPVGLPVPKATAFIGSSVVNRQGESLGKIEDLVIDPASGSITYAALSYGSILGIGGKLFAVAWKDLELQPDGSTFILNLPKERLESASGFDKNNWPRTSDAVLSVATRVADTGVSPLKTPGTAAAVSATVQTVNAPAETITVKTEQGERMDLRAPTAMLTRLQAGDNVEVKIVGTQATEIRKKEKAE